MYLVPLPSLVACRADASALGQHGLCRRADLKPRLFIPSVLIMAFTEEAEVALPPASHRSGAAKRKRARARHAATLNAAKLVQRVMLDGAEGDNVATGHAIRILGLTHETLQPTPHEAAKGSQGPIVQRFKRYDPSEDPIRRRRRSRHRRRRT